MWNEKNKGLKKRPQAIDPVAIDILCLLCSMNL
jgi:hypothetical protein